ncbi:hypothetical protein IAR55_002491 [Kwoniella newhampshirensis]|uniref:Glycosyltransferase family 8 protein n=1 Tax=Kwoniella newhampshirensis TaxID=1651941 RepID=A0AAW0Z1L8_9TREE
MPFRYGSDLENGITFSHVASPASRKASRQIAPVRLLTIVLITFIFIILILRSQLSEFPPFPFTAVYQQQLQSAQSLTSDSLFEDTDRPIVHPKPALPEVYMTLLSSSDIPEYYLSTRLLLYSLSHGPLTRDTERSFVVHVTPRTPLGWIETLRSEGASIEYTDLVTGLPLSRTEARYQDVYTKLAMWNMTQYSRILFLDADHLVLKGLEEIWDDEGGWSESGLGAIGASSNGFAEKADYFSAGFMMLRPDRERYEELLNVRGFNAIWREQNLLNKYYQSGGPQPWGRLDGKYQRIQPTYEHVGQGIHALHEKVWKDRIDPRLRNIWIEKVTEMEKFYKHRANETDALKRSP